MIPRHYRQEKCWDKVFHFHSLISFVFITSLLLDNERWKQAEVPAEFQDLVDSVSDGRISLIEKKPAGVYLAVLLLTVFITCKCCYWMLTGIFPCHSWSSVFVCLLSSGGTGRKLIPFSFLFSPLPFFPSVTSVETSCTNLKRWFMYLLKTLWSVSTGRELLFYTSIPSVESRSLCTNSVFPHNITLKCCKGPRSTCVCSAFLVLNNACSFPLLHLPVAQMKSMLCGCSWKWKFMYIQLFTFPQKPHLTSDKSLLSPCALFPHDQNGNALMRSYLVRILIQYCNDECVWTAGTGRNHT